MDANWQALLRALDAVSGQPGGGAVRAHLALLPGGGDGTGPDAGGGGVRALREWVAGLRAVLAADPALASALAANLRAQGFADAAPAPAGSSYLGDHVDFGNGLFLGDVTGTAEHHTHFHAAAQPPPAAVPSPPRQLPPDIPDFTGRADDLRTLDALSRAPGDDPLVPADRGAFAGGGAALETPAVTPTVVISAIDGTPGVGKTTLAVHWAHAASGRFPDGQIHFDLQGYAPTPAVKPRRALGELLRLLGVPAHEVPASLDARARSYRSLLAGRRVLVVLDNAEDPAQVRPLLPGAPGCCVVVTSRSRMAGLAIRDGARLLTLDVLDPQESLAFFARVLGGERVAAERAAALRVAELCGRLPLALRIAAVRLALRPSFGFADVEAELAPEEGRLAQLSRGSDEFAAVRHVFSWSYAKLTPPQQRAFRRLGLHRGPVFGAAAAEAVLGVPRDEARDLLDALTEAHLLEEDAPGRFRFHDLLRLYAQDRCRAQEPPAEAARAVERLLAWYVATGENADRALNDGREQVLAPIGVPEGVRPAWFAGADAALVWLDAEYANVLDVAQQAADCGLFTIGSRVPIVLRSYFQRRSQWPEWLEVQRVGLDAARAAGDGPAEAWLLSGLGDVYDDLERYGEALACHTQALEAHRRLGDRRGEATDLNNMGVALDNLERYAEAIEHYTGAERLFAGLGHLGGRAMALNNMGAAHMVCGDTDRAADCYRRSLEIRRAAGDDAFGEAMTLHNLGEVHEERGEWGQAAASYRQSLAVHRRVGHLRGEARALHRLGVVLAALGDREAARGSWERALEIFEDVGDVEADDVAALIDGREAGPST